MFSLLIVASTRYFPSNGDRDDRDLSGVVVGPSRPISPSSHRQMALGLAPGIIAAFRKP